VVSPRRGFRLLLIVAIVVIGLVISMPLWLPVFGYGLIHNDGPAKADLAVVLAGDTWGLRTERAAELVKQGYVPAVLVSGPRMYDVHECDLAIGMMVHKGYPANWFVPFPNNALSTREEGSVILRELRRRGIRSFLLVTSSYHTGRARRLYREIERQEGGPPFRMVAAEDEYFRPGSWWRTRESQKTVVIEWLKTVGNALGK
jgi:uncharacterized SAM-binding protein YcdF (DUF218 family)